MLLFLQRPRPYKDSNTHYGPSVALIKQNEDLIKIQESVLSRYESGGGSSVEDGSPLKPGGKRVKKAPRIGTYVEEQRRKKEELDKFRRDEYRSF